MKTHLAFLLVATAECAFSPTQVRARRPLRLGPLPATRVASPSAFADQAGTLAGALFPASLPSYFAFLYFLRYEKNGLSDTAKNGFTSLLAFVFATVVTSIVAVKGYGTTLANVDWLHADAEQLLTLTNVVEVLGLKLTLDGFVGGSGAPASGAAAAPPVPLVPLAGAAALTTCGLTYALSGGSLSEHTAFLGGLGNLPMGTWTLGFVEPANALSIPTWIVHVSSLLEWLVAMGLVWRIGIASGNERWKGMTWAMIPSHTSGICACVYHLFYNAPSVGYIVLLQALFTLVGNTTLAWAAYRLAASNGWSLQAALGSGEPPEPPEPPAASLPAAPAPVRTLPDGALLTVLTWTIAASYVIKYGETLLPFTIDDEVAPYAAAALISAPTALNVWKWSQRSQAGAEDFEGLI